MANKITLDTLGDAISEELTIYHEDLTKRINTLSAQAAKDLVKETKSSAPVLTGSYRRNIASKLLTQAPRGNTYVWYVKSPDHRLTHLLVHGHALPNGGRTRPDPFLQNAVNKVLPAFERSVKEAIKGDS